MSLSRRPAILLISIKGRGLAVHAAGAGLFVYFSWWGCGYFSLYSSTFLSLGDFSM